MCACERERACIRVRACVRAYVRACVLTFERARLSDDQVISAGEMTSKER